MQVLNESEKPMTYNQKMSLNEMAQINVRKMSTDEKSSFNCNSYYVYVKGEAAIKSFLIFISTIREKDGILG